MGKMVGAGAGAEIFDKLEPHKNGPAPQHWANLLLTCKAVTFCLRKRVE
jgi:hypothetical protein